MAWPSLMRQGLVNGAGQAAGDRVQATVGDRQFEGPAPQQGRDGASMPLTEQYSREQQSNVAFPPGRAFMGFPNCRTPTRRATARSSAAG